ncbi:type II toxin-antitoxin system VapC family toxin [Aquibium sp. ELW1220]|uniref:type II toxin-antitoxin system VapC family toxin n=1 Tax=Aquibium sp. ELW1220 TaxID=2976766 RepID=UPI00339D342D
MIFVDAAAIVAILGNEPEAKRCAAGILAYSRSVTSPVAVWEATVALARTDHLGLSPKDSARMVERFLQENGIELRQLPLPAETVELSTDAAHRYRSGRQRLNRMRQARRCPDPVDCRRVPLHGPGGASLTRLRLRSMAISCARSSAPVAMTMPK